MFKNILITIFLLEKNFFLRRVQASHITQSMEEHLSPLDLNLSWPCLSDASSATMGNQFPHLQIKLRERHIKWDNTSLILGK